MSAIARLLSARMAVVEADVDCSSLWFYGDLVPSAESIMRDWASDHRDAVTLKESEDGFSLEHRSYRTIATWYRSFAKAKADLVKSNWRPSDGRVQP